MGGLKQQKETLSGLFYNDFKYIFCEEKKRHTNKVIVTFKVCIFMISISGCEDIAL